MGISKFTSVFQPVGQIKLEKLKYLSIKRVGIDAFQELARFNSVKLGLTNKDGVPTQHIKFSIAAIVKAVKIGLDQLWVLDNRDPTAAKKPALERRKEARKNADEKTKALELEIEQLKKTKASLNDTQLAMLYPNFETDLNELEIELKRQKIGKNTNLHKMSEDLIFILSKLGIKYVIAPREYESEQIGAYLCRMSHIDAFISTDSDTLLFGCPIQIKKIPKKTGVYEIYTLKSCLEQKGKPDPSDEKKIIPLSRENFVKACVAMGSDFTKIDEHKRGVGPATIFKTLDTITLSAAQTEAYNIFMKPPTGLQVEITQTKRTKESVEELIRWMVDKHNFPEQSVRKQLKDFM